MKGIKQLLWLWIYPDNPMSILVDMFLVSIVIYFFYLVVFQDFLAFFRLDEKGMLDIERGSESEINEHLEPFDTNIDVNHEIGLALCFQGNPGRLEFLETSAGINAFEVYELLRLLWMDLKSVLDGMKSYVQINEEEISYLVSSGELIVNKNGSAKLRTGYGNADTRVSELRIFADNPYNFVQLASQMGLI